MDNREGRVVIDTASVGYGEVWYLLCQLGRENGHGAFLGADKG